MKIFKSKNGFTVLELLVTIGIFTLLLAMAMPTYSAIKTNIALKNDSNEIVNALRIAQNRSIVSLEGLPHGVYFEADKYILFAGDWPGSPSHTEYFLKRGVAVTGGAGTKVIFSRLTGETTAATIVIRTSPTSQKTITINEAGKVTIN